MSSKHLIILALYAFTPFSHAKTTAEPVTVTVDSDNRSAYASKYTLMKQARKSIDIATFLYGDDYSNSALTELLIEKATNDGVSVRLMLDGVMAEMHPDLFKTMVAKGQGNIRIAYYRPIPEAVYKDVESWGISDPKAFLKTMMWGSSEEKRKFIETNAEIQALLAKKDHPLSVIGLLFPQFQLPGRTFTPSDTGSFTSPDSAMRSSVKSSLSFHLRDWLDATKFLHHKLLVVDGEWVQGGGRNLEDSYHMHKDNLTYLREKEALLAAGKKAKYLFMDTDFVFQSKELGQAATDTLNGYWNCADKRTACPSANILVTEEHNLENKSDISSGIHTRAEEYLSDLTTQYGEAQALTPSPEHVFENAKVTYIENRLFNDQNKSKGLLYEEESEFHKVWIQEIEKSAAKKEDIFLHNAYTFFPTDVFLALVKAIRAGSQVILLTNSPKTSDLGYIAKAARLQYEKLLAVADHDPKRLMIFEYQTLESLHAKVTVFGHRAILVSSVNADPRCQYLDSGNGVLIERAAANPSDWESRVLKFRKSIFKTGSAIDLETQKITRVTQSSLEEEFKKYFEHLPSEAFRTKRRAQIEGLRKLVDLSSIDPSTVSDEKATRILSARNLLLALTIQM